MPNKVSIAGLRRPRTNIDVTVMADLLRAPDQVVALTDLIEQRFAATHEAVRVQVREANTALDRRSGELDERARAVAGDEAAFAEQKRTVEDWKVAQTELQTALDAVKVQNDTRTADLDTREGQIVLRERNADEFDRALKRVTH